jgi:hypothetical protein
MKKITLALIVLLFAGITFAEKIAGFPGLMKPRFIKTDGDDFLVCEGHVFRNYSLKSLKLKYTFGRKGEGPGEFQFPPRQVVIHPEYIYIESPEKISWFSRGEGKFINQKRKAWRNEFIPFINGKFIGSDRANFQPEKSKVSRSISIYDANGKKVKEIYKNERDTNFVDPNMNKKTVEFKMLFHFFEADCDRAKKRIFVADSRKGFYITVFDENGNKLYSINKKIDKIKVPGEFKKQRLKELKIMGYWAHIKNRNITCYEYFPPIRYFKIADGKIYVTTYKTKKEKVEFVVLDAKGNILKKVFLPFITDQEGTVVKFNLYQVKNNKLYCLIENQETEDWELHAYDI